VCESQLAQLFFLTIFSSEWEAKTGVVARRNVKDPGVENDSKAKQDGELRRISILILREDV
jgi:hypothetical protein